MSLYATQELAGVWVEQPVVQASMLGGMYARAWLELVAEDHSFTFKTPMQHWEAPGHYGPAVNGILWMARK